MKKSIALLAAVVLSASAAQSENASAQYASTDSKETIDLVQCQEWSGRGLSLHHHLQRIPAVVMVANLAACALQFEDIAIYIQQSDDEKRSAPDQPRQ